MKPKLIRLTTVALSLDVLLRGQLRFLNRTFEVIAVASGREPLDAVGQREGVRTVEIPMQRNIAPMADLVSLWRLFRLFRREKPHIVHANTPKGSLLGMLAARLAGVPHRLYTVTGLRFETERGLLRLLLLTMERITCACATRVIPEGRGVRDTLLREQITRKPLEVIHNGNINGIDLDWYARRDDVLRIAAGFRTKERFTFCFVGRLVRDKGIEELVRTFCRLTDRHPDARLLLVGPFEPELDPLHPDTEREILGNPRIRYTGYQTDIRPWLAASDALVFPSHREGFPNVLLQAAAMDLPAIATDINGCNEIILPGTNGVLVPVCDEDALFRAMSHFIEDPDRTSQMGAQARQSVAQRFNSRDVWESLKNLYCNLK